MRLVSSSANLVLQSMVVMGLSLVGSGTLRAQDPVKVAPDHFKVLLENNRVRVLDFHTMRGEKVGMHSHPDYITYLIAGSGKTKFTSSDGKVTEEAGTVGRAVDHKSETHASEYLGSGELHVLLIELKGPAPANQ